MKFNDLNATKLLTNHENAMVFSMSAAMKLYTASVTWSLNDSFYEKNDARLTRLRILAASCDPLFIGKLAVYTRQKMYLRSVPLVLLTELAKLHSGDNLVARVTEQVLQRADEITELLSCYELLNDRTTGQKRLNRLSKQLQHGLSMAFNKFDEYQFAKYNRDTSIKLRDALFLVHPKAKHELQQKLFDKIASNTLETPYTWETEISALGKVYYTTEENKRLAFCQKWEELIDSGKLGYMALLRNLRNIHEVGVSASHIRKIGNVLTDKEKVARARQFPFRYLAAYRELSCLSDSFSLSGFKESFNRLFSQKKRKRHELMDALEKAVQYTAVNMKGFDAQTSVLLACDVSGSMQKPVSAKSKILLYDIGLTLAMILHSISKNTTLGMFGDTWKIIPVSGVNILENVQAFYKREGEVGYATNGYLVIQDLLERKVKMDKIMLFTDCQLWNNKDNNGLQLRHLWLRYKKEIAAEARLYLFDLSGYGTVPLELAKNDVYLIAGWSDKVFDVLDAMERGNSAIAEINAIKL